MNGLRGVALALLLAVVPTGAPPRALAGDPPAPISVVRHADASLRGRVLDEAGKPITQADVRALLPFERTSGCEDRPSHPDDGDPLGITTTAADGSFEIAGLAMQEYAVRVTRAGFGVLVFHGCVAAPGGGPPLDLVLPPAVSVEGTVLDHTGKGVAGAVVWAWMPTGDG